MNKKLIGRTLNVDMLKTYSTISRYHFNTTYHLQGITAYILGPIWTCPILKKANLWEIQALPKEQCVIFTILVSFLRDNALFASKAKINVF